MTGTPEDFCSQHRLLRQCSRVDRLVLVRIETVDDTGPPAFQHPEYIATAEPVIFGTVHVAVLLDTRARLFQGHDQFLAVCQRNHGRAVVPEGDITDASFGDTAVGYAPCLCVSGTRPLRACEANQGDQTCRTSQARLLKHCKSPERGHNSPNRSDSPHLSPGSAPFDIKPGNFIPGNLPVTTTYQGLLTLMGISLLGPFFCPARQNECSVVTLHERVITQLGKKMGPASFSTTIGVESNNSPLSVARRLFGVTKLLSSRLDW